MGLGACALPQRAERYHFGREGAADAVSATRYAGKQENPLDRIEIKLRGAAPFQVRLPDGFWARSNEISRDTLVRHGLIGPTNQDESYVVWHPSIPLLASLVGRHQYMAFRLDKDRSSYQLELGACGYSFDQILRTGDGERTYGFPLPVEHALELFGKPSRIEVFEILTGFSCF